nr:MAG TPA: hypothetical protein [Caudoviricetes sp.]
MECTKLIVYVCLRTKKALLLRAIHTALEIL